MAQWLKLPLAASTLHTRVSGWSPGYSTLPVQLSATQERALGLWLQPGTAPLTEAIFVFPSITLEI